MILGMVTQFWGGHAGLGLTRFGVNTALGGTLGGEWLHGGGPSAQAGLWGPPISPPTGYTPLHVAVLRRDLELVQLLLRAGADPDRPVGAPPKKTHKQGWRGGPHRH